MTTPAPRRRLQVLTLPLVFAAAACGEEAANTDPVQDAAGAVPDPDAAVPEPDAAVPEPDAAAPEPDAAPAPPAFCTGAVAHRWDPAGATEPDFFPDGLLTRPDDTSPTGLRLDLSPEAAPWVETSPALVRDSVRAMNALSGFGTMGGVLLRFTAPVNTVPTGADASLASEGWQWWDLGGETPERVPFEAKVLEGGLTVVLWPLRPLRLATPHALVLTRAATADDGGCIAPAPTTRALLGDPTATAPDPARVERFGPAYRAAIDRLGVEPADVSVLSVYTTHDDLLPVRAAAADVLTRPVAWGPSAGCGEPDGAVVECEASTTVLDYRDEAGVVDGTRTPREGTIPVTWWKPAQGEGPFPVIVYGHGLNSRRDEGRQFADRVAELGIAVVAMEAVEHGDHPFIAPDATGEDAMRFLGLNLAGLKIDAPRLAGNFNQTDVDRIRLIGLLRQNGDLDGDGAVDLDPTRIAYLGASLGAMCGAGVLALSPDLDAAALTIGGGRLISVVTDTELVAQYRPLIGNLAGSVENFDRIVPIAQHVIDAADPGTWAAHVLRDRFDGRTPPSLLASYGMSDEVVPPSAGRSLARALGAPQLAPVHVPVELVEVIEAPEVAGNLADGTRTAAFSQFVTVTRDGRSEPATHVDTAKSDEVAEQLRGFFGTWAAGEVPVIRRPE
jgi:dienelactone hydrolase